MIFSLLLLIGVTGTFWGSSMALAVSSIWNSCPNGKVNDAYPGDCLDYIDTNNDRICDRSQPAPQTTASTTTSVSGALLDSPITAAASGDITSTSTGSTSGDDANTAATGHGHSYYFVPVVAVFIALYCLTWILSAKKIIKTLLHRKIWNIVLLVSALVSALLGIILVLNIDFNTHIVPPFNTLFWHVEAGVALAVVAVFHIA
jgi:hypothetical protein